MKTSMRIMFLALIAAMAVGYAELRSHNAALEAQATAVTP
jgi:hypothetical protein